jgi:hypothetical protein
MITLSAGLSTLLCGNGVAQPRMQMTEREALRLLGRYCSSRGLRDPLDRRRIICDAVRGHVLKLRECRAACTCVLLRAHLSVVACQALQEIAGKSSFTVFEARRAACRSSSRRASISTLQLSPRAVCWQIGAAAAPRHAERRRRRRAPREQRQQPQQRQRGQQVAEAKPRRRPP